MYITVSTEISIINLARITSFFFPVYLEKHRHEKHYNKRFTNREPYFPHNLVRIIKKSKS